MTSQCLILQFAKLLRWNAEGDVLADEFALRHVETLAERLGRTLSRLRSIDAGESKALAARLHDLPDSSFQRILTAPRTCLHLSYSNAAELPATLAYLREAVAFEDGRVNGWSYLGDLYLPTGADKGSGLELGSALSVGRPWRPPSLLRNITVDYSSPFANGSIPEIPGVSVGFDPAELQNTLARLQSAAAGIQRVPVAAGHLQRFVRTLVIRKDPTAPARFASASSQLTIGLVVLRNPQLAIATPTEIADGLIHEMIHLLSDIIELREPFIRDTNAAATIRVDSPWTGRSLDLNTYLQACYVWYGLWEFWLAAFGTDGFDEREVAVSFQRASMGFRRGIIEPLVPLAHALAPGLLDELAQVQSRTRDALGQLDAGEHAKPGEMNLPRR